MQVCNHIDSMSVLCAKNIHGWKFDVDNLGLDACEISNMKMQLSRLQNVYMSESSRHWNDYKNWFKKEHEVSRDLSDFIKFIKMKLL